MRVHIVAHETTDTFAPSSFPYPSPHQQNDMISDSTSSESTVTYPGGPLFFISHMITSLSRTLNVPIPFHQHSLGHIHFAIHSGADKLNRSFSVLHQSPLSPYRGTENVDVEKMVERDDVVIFSPVLQTTSVDFFMSTLLKLRTTGVHVVLDVQGLLRYCDNKVHGKVLYGYLNSVNLEGVHIMKTSQVESLYLGRSNGTWCECAKYGRERAWRTCHDEHVWEFMRWSGVEVVLVTMSERGCRVYNSTTNDVQQLPVSSTAAVVTMDRETACRGTGSGDCFVAGFVVGYYVLKKSLSEAVKMGNACGHACVNGGDKLTRG